MMNRCHDLQNGFMFSKDIMMEELRYMDDTLVM